MLPSAGGGVSPDHVVKDGVPENSSVLSSSVSRNHQMMGGQAMDGKEDIQYASVLFLKIVEQEDCLISKNLEQKFMLRNTYFQVQQRIDEYTGTWGTAKIPSSRFSLIEDPSQDMLNHNDYPSYKQNKLVNDFSNNLILRSFQMF